MGSPHMKSQIAAHLLKNTVSTIRFYFQRVQILFTSKNLNISRSCQRSDFNKAIQLEALNYNSDLELRRDSSRLPGLCTRTVAS